MQIIAILNKKIDQTEMQQDFNDFRLIVLKVILNERFCFSLKNKTKNKKHTLFLFKKKIYIFLVCIQRTFQK